MFRERELRSSWQSERPLPGAVPRAGRDALLHPRFPGQIDELSGEYMLGGGVDGMPDREGPLSLVPTFCERLI
jgi:hypothetical protein